MDLVKNHYVTSVAKVPTLCRITLCYVALRYAIFRYDMLRYAMLCYVMLCYVMLRCIMLYYVTLRYPDPPSTTASLHGLFSQNSLPSLPHLQL